MMTQNKFTEAWNAAADDAKRQAVVDVIKQTREEMRRQTAEILDRQSDGGLQAMYANADALDEMLSDLMDFLNTSPFPNQGDGLSLIAVGGYGRRELAPFSDVDILFLSNGEADEKAQELISGMTSLLWDAGVKPGCAVRTPADCVTQAKSDITVCTNLLESRLIWGDISLFDEFYTRYEALRTADDGRRFYEAKLTERGERYRRMGLSKYMLEPNIKEGRGGLRDLHLMFWLAKYLFNITDMHDLVTAGIIDEPACRKFLTAHRFLTTVRCRLHLLNGRAGDNLSFDAQQKIAEQMGYAGRSGQFAVERFMKRYYMISKTVGELSGRIIVAISDMFAGSPDIEPIEGANDFHLLNGRIAFNDDVDFDACPILLLKAFVWRQRLQKSLNPEALRLISNHAKLARRVRLDEQAHQLFFEILRSEKPETALRQMTESGVLGYLIPSFQHIIAQVQFDMYHVYTTDEHTLKTIGYLQETDADKTPESKTALYLGALLHDIGKGRGGDHAAVGAKLAEGIVADLGVETGDAETVVWLVGHHLMMSQTAFRRDIFDPKTIADFVAVVQSPERLKLLYALTVADIKAVGPNVWNSFKEKLLRDLFAFSLEKMQGADDKIRRLSPTQQEMAEKSAAKEYAFGLTTDDERGVSEFIVLAPDHDGLFAEITGAMAAEDVSVVEAQIATLDNGMALDTFLIQETDLLNEKKPLTSAKKIARLQQRISSPDLDAVEQKLSQKRAGAPVSVLWSPPRVFINNAASDSRTLIEINGTDCVGFLHAITHAMTRLNLKIVSAHVYTYGSRVVDVFYVTDAAGRKIADDDQITRIKTDLLDTINACTSFSR